MKINVYYYVQASFSRDLVDVESIEFYRIARNIKNLATIPPLLESYKKTRGNKLAIDFHTIKTAGSLISILRKILDVGPDLGNTENHLFLNFDDFYSYGGRKGRNEETFIHLYSLFREIKDYPQVWVESPFSFNQCCGFKTYYHSPSFAPLCVPTKVFYLNKDYYQKKDTRCLINRQKVKELIFKTAKELYDSEAGIGGEYRSTFVLKTNLSSGSQSTAMFGLRPTPDKCDWGDVNGYLIPLLEKRNFCCQDELIRQELCRAHYKTFMQCYYQDIQYLEFKYFVVNGVVKRKTCLLMLDRRAKIPGKQPFRVLNLPLSVEDQDTRNVLAFYAKYIDYIFEKVGDKSRLGSEMMTSHFQAANKLVERVIEGVATSFNPVPVAYRVDMFYDTASKRAYLNELEPLGCGYHFNDSFLFTGRETMMRKYGDVLVDLKEIKGDIARDVRYGEINWDAINNLVLGTSVNKFSANFLKELLLAILDKSGQKFIQVEETVTRKKQQAARMSQIRRHKRTHSDTLKKTSRSSSSSSSSSSSRTRTTKGKSKSKKKILSSRPISTVQTFNPGSIATFLQKGLK